MSPGRVARACALVMLAGSWMACQPNGPDALLKGERQLGEGKVTQAIESFQHAAQLMPEDWRPLNFLGMAFHRDGKLEDAKKYYDKALAASRLQPATQREANVLQYNLGRLYLDLGRVEQAMQVLTTYTLQAPNSFEGFLLRGTAETTAATQLKQPTLLERAEISLQKAVQLNPKSASAYNRLGVVQMQRGLVEKAKASFGRAHQEDASHEPALYNLAEAYFRHPTGDKHAAKQLAWKYFQDYLHLDGELPSKEAAQTAFNQLNFELHPPLAGLPAQPVPAVPNIPEPPRPLAPLRESNVVVRVAFPKSNGNEPQRGVIITNLPPVAVQPTPVIPVPPRPPVVVAPPVLPPTNQVAKVIPPPVVKPELVKPEPPLPTPPPVVKVEPPKLTPAPVVPVVPPPAVVVPPVAAKVDDDKDWAKIARYNYSKPTVPSEGDRKKANEHFEKALHAHKINHLKDAMTGYREALKADPAYPQAYANLALAAFHSGDLKQATQSYEMALAINPLSLDTRYNFALALQRGKFMVDAAKELERLVVDYPSLLQAHLLLGNLYAEELARPLRAKPHYAKVLQMDPGHEQAPNIRQWLSAHP